MKAAYARNLEHTTAFINAGGRGTRLADLLTGDPITGVTKALVEVGRPPIKLIDHHLRQLKWLGFDHAVVSAGDHQDVKAYVDAHYASDHVTTVTFPEQHGNAGDMLKALRAHPELIARQVFIQNVDTILDIDPAFFTAHKQFGAAATIALTTRRGVPNEGAFGVAMSGRIIDSRESTSVDFSSTEPIAYRASSTGAVMMNRDYMESYPWDFDTPLDLYKHMLGTALGRGSLAGFNNGERFFMDIGTVQTYSEAQNPNGPVQPTLSYAIPLA